MLLHFPQIVSSEVIAYDDLISMFLDGNIEAEIGKRQALNVNICL